MEFPFSPTSPAPGTSQVYGSGLGFIAKAVRVTSGSNYVLIQPDNYTIAPGAIDAIYPLNTPSQVAQFTLTAPPAGPGIIGPPQQNQTTITYTDDALPPSGGLFSAPQTVSAFAEAIGAGVPRAVFTGLARAFTIFVWTQDGANHNITFFGREPTIAGGPQITLLTNNASGQALSAGQGTLQASISATPFPQTYHLWPEFLWNCDANYYYTARLYY